MRTQAHSIKTIIAEKVSSKVLFFVLAAVLVLIFASYAYLLNKTIMNVVVREKTEQQIATLSSVIGELEFEHMTAKNKITLELAYEKGFVDTIPARFIARSGTTLLSYNSQ
jgi:hypothetical protein